MINYDSKVRICRLKVVLIGISGITGPNIARIVCIISHIIRLELTLFLRGSTSFSLTALFISFIRRNIVIRSWSGFFMLLIFLRFVSFFQIIVIT